MADIWSGQTGNQWCPQIHLVVSLAAGNADHDILNWAAYYVAHGYAAYTNGHARAWSINIDGQVRSGSFNINGHTGTVTLGSGQVRVNKQHVYRNISVSCSMTMDFTWNGSYLGTASASGTHPIGEKVSYKVSYNANGSYGAPGNQIKWYGENLTLSGTKPTRTGNNFAGWATSASGGVAYQPGATYTGNGDLTLYAKWTPHTYTVSYNANGGTGAPGNQTKTYGQTLKLSTTIPKRTNYIFKGWGTSAGSTSVAYAAGANYTNNSAVTLYAVWELAWLEPRITNLQATRCDSAGSLKEDGQYAKVTFNWATDRTVSAIKIVCNGVTVNGSGSGTSGSISLVLGNNALSTENSYPVTVTVTDAVGGATISTTVAPMDYIMDVAPNGSVAFGKPANRSTRELEIAGRVRFSGAAVGFQWKGYATDGKSFRVLARSANTYDDSDSGGGVRIVGYLGGYLNANSIDVTVPFRGGEIGMIEVNSIGYSTVTDANCSLQVIAGSDKYIYIVIWRNANGGYPYYDLQLYGDEVRIVNGDWTAAPPAGPKRFVSNELERNEFFNVVLPLRNRFKNGYPGMASLRGEDDWLRTTKNGLIPYQAGGASALGSESWPFNNIYTKNMYINNSRIADHVVASGTSGIWRYIKWNNGAAECWARELSVANANGYYAISYYEYPFTIYAASAVVSLKDHTHTGNTAHNMSFMDRYDTYVEVKIASDTGEILDLGSKKIDVHVKGRWK